jgi:hypothetical protein
VTAKQRRADGRRRVWRQFVSVAFGDLGQRRERRLSVGDWREQAIDVAQPAIHRATSAAQSRSNKPDQRADFLGAPARLVDGAVDTSQCGNGALELMVGDSAYFIRD